MAQRDLACNQEVSDAVAARVSASCTQDIRLQGVAEIRP